MELEDHFDEFSVRVLGIDGGVCSRNANVMICENGRDFCDDAWAVIDRKADVVRSFRFVDWDELSFALVGEESS